MIKIVAESVSKRNKTVFVVKAIEGEDVLSEGTATTINKRDELIWSFAEQYNTTDITILNSDRKDKNLAKQPKKDKFKYSEIPSIPVLDMEDAKDFFDDNEDIVYNRVLVAVREGLECNKDVIKLFELNGTGVYLTSEREDWKPGLENARMYFQEKELYEKCAECRDLMAKL